MSLECSAVEANQGCDGSSSIHKVNLKFELLVFIGGGRGIVFRLIFDHRLCKTIENLSIRHGQCFPGLRKANGASN